jgi:hypothetical protein
MAETRPDVLFARVSSRGTSMSAPVLEGYRERLCRHGFGPYKGLNVPSSGWVAANLMLQVCGRGLPLSAPRDAFDASRTIGLGGATDNGPCTMAAHTSASAFVGKITGSGLAVALKPTLLSHPLNHLSAPSTSLTRHLTNLVADASTCCNLPPPPRRY